LGAALQPDGEYEVRVYGLKRQKEKHEPVSDIDTVVLYSTKSA
jgi:hypothetical protein